VTIDRDRRHFLSVALTAAAAFVAAGCSPSHSKARPRRSASGVTSGGGSFGGRIDAGAIDDIRRTLASTREPFYVADARSYVVEFPANLADRARGAYPDDALPMLEAGIIVLYQRCTHLGCRVPWCKTSEWFECPCHAARFDQVGEKRAGPAPRGMDLVQSSIKDGRLVLDTGKVLPGAAIGTNTTNQEPAGPFCVNNF
jgi:cytochrome b6-f complex iron-sulfur subunit